MNAEENMQYRAEQNTAEESTICATCRHDKMFHMNLYLEPIPCDAEIHLAIVIIHCKCDHFVPVEAVNE